MPLTEKAKEMRRAYMREWRKKNRDKVRATEQRYWEKKAAAANDQQSNDAAE